MALKEQMTGVPGGSSGTNIAALFTNNSNVLVSDLAGKPEG